jgi:uncharacterized membrane protein YraQ (UPF0718 family)
MCLQRARRCHPTAAGHPPPRTAFDVHGHPMGWPGGAGTLLVTLPAVSLPGMLMVGRSFEWRVTTATAGVAVARGVLAAGLLSLLGG